MCAIFNFLTLKTSMCSEYNQYCKRDRDRSPVAACFCSKTFSIGSKEFFICHYFMLIDAVISKQLQFYLHEDVTDLIKRINLKKHVCKLTNENPIKSIKYEMGLILI